MFVLAAAAAAVAVAASSCLDAVRDRLEEMIADAHVTLRGDTPIPFLEGNKINQAWKLAVHDEIDRQDPGMSMYFVDWYLQEEAKAIREQRSPRLPWQKPLRYPALYAGRACSVEPADMQVTIRGDGHLNFQLG